MRLSGHGSGGEFFRTLPQRGYRAEPRFQPWDWSLAVKELGKSVKYSGMKLWLGFLRVVVQGEVGPEVGKTFWSYRVVP